MPGSLQSKMSEVKGTTGHQQHQSKASFFATTQMTKGCPRVQLSLLEHFITATSMSPKRHGLPGRFRGLFREVGTGTQFYTGHRLDVPGWGSPARPAPSRLLRATSRQVKASPSQDRRWISSCCNPRGAEDISNPSPQDTEQSSASKSPLLPGDSKALQLRFPKRRAQV